MPEALTDTAVRSHLALALDVDDAVEAVQLARVLRPWFGIAKVGLELFTAAGPDMLGRLIEMGYDVFLDIKLLDIARNVNRVARVAGSFGVKYLTIHAQSGAEMLRAGQEGFLDGALAAGLEPPCALAVTVLSSDPDAPRHVLMKRIMWAIEAGCGGLVCAADDLQEIRQLAPAMITVVPGIRSDQNRLDDQDQRTSVGEAIGRGASMLVIGRAVTAAPDRLAAARSVFGDVRDAIQGEDRLPGADRPH